MPHTPLPLGPHAARLFACTAVLALLLAGLGGAQDTGERRLDRYRAYLDRSPHHERAFEGLVEAARAAGAVEELLRDYRARLASDPEDGAARTVLARLLGAEDRAPEALALVRETAAPAPRDHLLRARLEREAGRLDAALDAVRRARAELAAGDRDPAPDLADLLIDEEAELHLLRGDSAAAARTFTALADARPGDPERALDVAQRLHAAGLRADALAAYVRAEDLLGDDPERRARALAAQGGLLEELGEGRSALDVYARTLPLLAADHWLRRDLLERTLELHRRAGTLPRAASSFRAALRNTPGDLGLRLALVRALELDRRDDQALQELGRAVALAPRDVELARRYATALLAQGRAEAYAAELQRALELAPRDRELRFELGLALGRLERFEGADREWSRLREVTRDDPATLRRIALAWDGLGEPERARRAFGSAIAAAPHEARYPVDLARYLGDAGDRAGAREVLAAAEPAIGDRPPELGLVAEALVEHGRDPVAAARLWSRIVQLAPSDTDALRRLADLEVELDRPAAALRHLRRWIEVAGEVPGRGRVAADYAELVPQARRVAELKSLADEAARHGAALAPSLLGAALAERVQRDATARKLLTRAVAHRPDDAALRAHLAERLQHWNETDAALGQLDILVARDPARASVYLLRRIALGLRSPEYRDVVAADLARVRALLPGDAGTWREVAAAYERLGETSEAVACLGQALRIDPEDAAAQLRLGRLQADLGRRIEAYATYQAAWRHGSPDERAAAVEGLWRLLGDRRGIQSELRRLRRLTLRDPFDTETPRMLAQLALRAGDPSGAALVLGDLLRREGDRADLLRLRAEAGHALRRSTSARADLLRLAALGESVDELALRFARGHLQENRVTQAVQVALVAEDPLPFVAELVARDERRAAMTLVRRIERRRGGASRDVLFAKARVHESLGEGHLALRALDDVERREGSEWRLAERMGELAHRLGDTRRFDAEGERMIDLGAPAITVEKYFTAAERREVLTRIRCRRAFDSRRDATALEVELAGLLVDGYDAPATLELLDRILVRARHPAERPSEWSGADWMVALREWRLRVLTRHPAVATERRNELQQRLRSLDELTWVEYLHLEIEDVVRVPEAGPATTAARRIRAGGALRRTRERFARSVEARAACARLALAVGDLLEAERELSALADLLSADRSAGDQSLGARSRRGPRSADPRTLPPSGDGRSLGLRPSAEETVLLLARVVARRGDGTRARALIEARPALAADELAVDQLPGRVVRRVIRLGVGLEVAPRWADVSELGRLARAAAPVGEAERARLIHATAHLPLALFQGAARRAAIATVALWAGAVAGRAVTGLDATGPDLTEPDLTGPGAAPARGSR